MNHLFKIKICGVTTPADAKKICELGADAIGINFYPHSKRCVPLADAIRVSQSIHGYNSSHPPGVKLVGLFVNSDLSDIENAISRCGLDIVQLHGDEIPSLIEKIRHQIKSPIKIIRAIRSNPAEPRNLELAQIQQQIDAWIAAGVDGVLLDAAAPGTFGGTGNTLDWSVVPELTCRVPLTLAGGLRPGNVAAAIRISGVGSVDVASGVELAPGKKDPQQVADFIRNAS